MSIHVIGALLVVKIGLIGYRNHAEKLKSIVNKNKNSEIEYIFHPHKKIIEKKFTNDIKKLFETDAIIIASPNQTHVKYLKKILKNFNGYIFCEKPPANNKNELKYLKKILKKDRTRIFFNFNFRFSSLNEIIQQHLNSKHIGKIMYINIISSQGLAFKKEYPNSWRADKNNIHNIVKSVSIHYLDLLNLHYKIKKIRYYPKLISKNGNSYDTSHLLIEMENDIIATIFNSYATPFMNEITVIGTNGYYSIKDNEFKIHSPRNTFNSKKKFISPPIKSKMKFNWDKNYLESLERSFAYFIECVKNKKNIETKYYNASIKTNEQILNLVKN